MSSKLSAAAQFSRYATAKRSSNLTLVTAQIAIDTKAEAPVLTGQTRQPSKTIILGTRANGVLATSVAWDAI